MWLNVRRRFRGPSTANQAFGCLQIDTALLFILLLNCFTGIFGLFFTAIFHQELINTKCYFRHFLPILFVLQFIPIFWMFANDSPKAAFIALYCEIIGTMALIAGNLAYCSIGKVLSFRVVGVEVVKGNKRFFRTKIVKNTF